MVSLVSCSTLKYQEPLEGPRARVRFVTTTDDIAILRTYDDVNCERNESEWMRLRDGPLWVGKPKTLGIPLWSYNENAAKEVFVQASKQINGMFFGGEDDVLVVHLCAVPFFYSFAENSDYEVMFKWDRKQCMVVISKIVGDKYNWSLLEVARFDNRIKEANRGCLTQFYKARFN